MQTSIGEAELVGSVASYGLMLTAGEFRTDGCPAAGSARVVWAVKNMTGVVPIRIS